MPYFIWYRSPALFLAHYCVLIAFFAFDHFKMVIQNSNYLKWMQVGFSLLVFAVSLYMFAKYKLYIRVIYYDITWLNGLHRVPHLIQSSRRGMPDNSFFSDRTFINLDGVINNVDYYQRVLQGSIPLTDYLSENEVAYIVDYDSYSSIPDFLVVQTFPINDGSDRAIHIWQVSSEIVSTP
jgi:hypothetical protein